MKTIIDTTMRLTEHFTLGEMCYSATADDKQIPNIPLKQHITALQNLCVRCLEPVRQQLGLPIKVNSGYRCQLLNQMVGGVPTSQHLKGEAADITVFDLEKEFTVDPSTFLTKGRSTPFEGWHLQGECCLTLVDGRIAYEK